MSDLTAWIAEQTKRGYSREQIKQALMQKGYPATALSEIDSIQAQQPLEAAPIKPASARQISPTIIYCGLVIIIVILALTILMSYLQPKKAIDVPSKGGTGLMPLSELTNGRPVKSVRGVLTNISQTSITLANQNGTYEYPLLKERPPQYVSASGGKLVVLDKQPQATMIPAHIFISSLENGESYVVRVILNPDKAK